MSHAEDIRNSLLHQFPNIAPERSNAVMSAITSLLRKQAKQHIGSCRKSVPIGSLPHSGYYGVYLARFPGARNLERAAQ